jgi:hypothetical protein
VKAYPVAVNLDQETVVVFLSKIEVVGLAAFAVDAKRPRSGGWFVHREKQFPPPAFEFFNQLAALENGHRRVIKVLHDENACVGAGFAAYPFSGDLSERLDEPGQIELFEQDSQALDHSPASGFSKKRGLVYLEFASAAVRKPEQAAVCACSGAKALFAVEGPPWLLSLTPAGTAPRDSAGADFSGPSFPDRKTEVQRSSAGGEQAGQVLDAIAE